MQSSRANGLNWQELSRTSNVCGPTKQACALQFIDSSGRSFAAVVNSNGIASVIGRLLDQASNPDFGAAALVANGGLAQCQINGDALGLSRGRSPEETAVTLSIGCIELVVFLPLVDVITEFGDFALQLQAALPEGQQ